MENTFEDLIFPRDNNDLNARLEDEEDEWEFTRCYFQCGDPIYIPFGNCSFFRCHFQKGCQIYFYDPDCFYFTCCTFDDGAYLNLGNDCRFILLDICAFRSRQCVFNTRVDELTFTPLLCDDTVFQHLPPYRTLNIHSGIGELTRPLTGLQKHVPIYYHLDTRWKQPQSYDMLEHSLFQNPSMILSSGEVKDYPPQLLLAVSNHPNRQALAIIVTLLSIRQVPRLSTHCPMKRIPEDLIRMVFGFLV